jgi:hypothetical protein
MSAFESIAESVALELLRQAVRLGGDAVHSILDRGTWSNDAPLASRIRGMLHEESDSRKAARSLGDKDAPGD